MAKVRVELAGRCIRTIKALLESIKQQEKAHRTCSSVHDSMYLGIAHTTHVRAMDCPDRSTCVPRLGDVIT